jgi:hypothetical protein
LKKSVINFPAICIVQALWSHARTCCFIVNIR